MASADAQQLLDLTRGLVQRVDEGAQAVGPQELDALVDGVRQLDLSDVDPYTADHLLHGVLEIEAAERSQDEAVAVRLGLETVRQSLQRLVERELVSDRRPIAEVIRWLLETTHVSAPRLAGLINVDASTLRRWASGDVSGSVESDEMARARVVARVVSQLRHVLTAGGTVRWLETGNPELKGSAPVEILEDPVMLPRLLALVGQGRSQAAS